MTYQQQLFEEPLAQPSKPSKAKTNGWVTSPVNAKIGTPIICYHRDMHPDMGFFSTGLIAKTINGERLIGPSLHIIQDDDGYFINTVVFWLLVPRINTQEE